MPPSLEHLKKRLQGRGQDENNVVLERLALAEEEMEKSTDFDYIIMNDDFDSAVRELHQIVNRSI